MSFTAIRTFLAILEAGSLGRAAERLNVTHSTVTARLKALEEDLGHTLIKRANKKTEVGLTSHGFRFKRYAEAMADIWEQARSETAMTQGSGSVCNLGCHFDLWQTWGMVVFDEIQNRHPQTLISAWPGNQVLLEQWLSTSLIDAALTYEIKVMPNQTIYTLPDEELSLYSTEPSEVANQEQPSVFVDAAHGDFSRRYTSALTQPDIAKVSFGSASWALEYILSRGGTAYLPTGLAKNLETSGRLYRVVNAPEFKRQRFLVVDNTAATNWPWLAGLVKKLSL